MLVEIAHATIINHAAHC